MNNNNQCVVCFQPFRVDKVVGCIGNTHFHPGCKDGLTECPSCKRNLLVTNGSDKRCDNPACDYRVKRHQCEACYMPCDNGVLHEGVLRCTECDYARQGKHRCWSCQRWDYGTGTCSRCKESFSHSRTPRDSTDNDSWDAGF